MIPSASCVTVPHAVLLTDRALGTRSYVVLAIHVINSMLQGKAASTALTTEPQQPRVSKRHVVSHQEGGLQGIAGAPPRGAPACCAAIGLCLLALPLGLSLAFPALALQPLASKTCFCCCRWLFDWGSIKVPPCSRPLPASSAATCLHTAAIAAVQITT